MGDLLPRPPISPATPFLREDRTMKPWKLFWVLALAAAGPLEGQATGQITGIVRSSDGQPTASATVMVRGTRMSTVTGTDGGYTLPEGPPRAYTGVAALIRYSFPTAT